MSSIRTARLELRPGRVEDLEAELNGVAALAATLRVHVPDNWPPPLYDEPAARWSLGVLRSAVPGAAEYNLYYFIDVSGDSHTAVGMGGFKGPPKDGRVEIGYSILPQFHRRGYASEAVSGFVKHAFSSPEIEEVLAETLPGLDASIGVLLKNGFTPVGPGSEEGVIRYSLPRTAWIA